MARCGSFSTGSMTALICSVTVVSFGRGCWSVGGDVGLSWTLFLRIVMPRGVCIVYDLGPSFLITSPFIHGFPLWVGRGLAYA